MPRAPFKPLDDVLASPDLAQIVSFKIANGALAATDLPKRLKLLNWGENPTIKGKPLLVGKKTLEVMAHAQKALGFDRVALDYAHNSLPSSPNYKPDPREHAAFGTPVVIEGDGLYMVDLEYTPSGEKYAREYPDLSPSVVKDDAGEVLFLHSTALCTQGAVDGLSFYSAAFLSDHPPKTTTQKNMDPKKLLLAILGLPDTADDATIQQAAEKFVKDKTDANSAATAAKAKEAAEALEKAKGTGAIEALSATVAGLVASNERTARENLVRQAVLEGKVIPLSAEEIGKTPVDVLTSMIGKIPVTVPVEARTPGAANVEAHSAGFDPEIAAACGISRERFDKVNGITATK